VLRAIGRRLRRRRLAASTTFADVAIVVLNWNRRDDTCACLRSLARATLRGARVVVVDNGSTDGSESTIRAEFPDVVVLRVPENLGFAGGNNVGIRWALEHGAAAVLLLNNDTEVDPPFLDAMMEVLDAQDDAAAVSGGVHRADSPLVFEVAYLDIHFGHGLVHRRGVNALPNEGFDRVREVEVGLGSCLLMRASALARVGLLDEDYFAYHEEVDWCFRARQAGFRIYFQPHARVWHKGSRSTSALIRPLARPPKAAAASLPNPVPLSWNPIRTYLGARNTVRFLRRHGGRWRRVRFVFSTLYAVPLELLAVVMQREEDLMLGLWTYRRFVKEYCFTASPASSDGSADVSLGAIVRAPGRLFVSLPRDVRHAHRAGYTAQVIEHLRGLWDGWRDRPLPLERLGLR